MSEELAIVRRHPCGCLIEHGGVSCVHVDAQEARNFGSWLAAANVRAAEAKAAEEPSA